MKYLDFLKKEWYNVTVSYVLPFFSKESEMELGEKIKKLRCEKMMTQSELVGNEITRNMLSRIENGTANPSLETIRYIAQRLNVSPGFLLAQGNDEQIYFKHSEIIAIKQAYLTEDYRICRDICLHSDSAQDDEICMILAECNLAIAIEEFERGNLREACRYFDETLEACGRTVYRTDYLSAVVGTYFRYMRKISATLASNLIDEGAINVYPSLTDAFCRYAFLIDAMEESGKPFDGALEIDSQASPFTIHYQAMLLMRQKNYSAAYELLHAILLDERVLAEPVLYFVLCDLEICCRELENFKGAYEYSIDKIELLQKLLR